MRALIATAAFAKFAGSELVALEFLESLRERHIECELFTYYHGEPLFKFCKNNNITVLTDPKTVRLFDYDIAWIQNQIAPTLDLTIDSNSRPRTLRLFAHLDLKWPLAAPGILENLIADRFMYCSPEAQAQFSVRGLDPERGWVFFNAAPKHFVRPRRQSRQLTHLTLISNHAPDEVREAVAILQQRGIRTTHYGTGGDIENTRIMPEHFDATDAVLCIGKSVQYGLLSRTPLYIYDHLGGPGWLLESNFSSCAFHNFSGRCCSRKIESFAIADEISSGFVSAGQFIDKIDDQSLEKYTIENHIQKLLDIQSSSISNYEINTVMERNSYLISSEQSTARSACSYFRSTLQLFDQRDSLTKQLARIRGTGASSNLPFPDNKEIGDSTSEKEFLNGKVALRNGNGFSRLIPGNRYRLHANIESVTTLEWNLRSLSGDIKIACSAGTPVPECANVFFHIEISLNNSCVSMAKELVNTDKRSISLISSAKVMPNDSVTITVRVISARSPRGAEKAVIDLEPLKLTVAP